MPAALLAFLVLPLREITLGECVTISQLVMVVTNPTHLRVPVILLDARVDRHQMPCFTGYAKSETSLSMQLSSPRYLCRPGQYLACACYHALKNRFPGTSPYSFEQVPMPMLARSDPKALPVRMLPDSDPVVPL